MNDIDTIKTMLMDISSKLDISCKDISLKEWINTWYKKYKLPKCKPSTLYQYRLNLKYIPLDMLYQNINSITSSQVEQLILDLKHCSRQAQKVYKYLKDIFNKAELNGYLNKNIFDLMTVPVYESKTVKYLSSEQIVKFKYYLKATNNKYADFYLILLYTGVRCGELLALNGNDIDIVNNCIRINKTVSMSVVQNSTKSRSSMRVIPILKPIKQILTKYSKIKGRIFNISDSVLSYHFHRTANFIDKELTIHSLRHTFATMCLRFGISKKQIQQWLGHSRYVITMNIYAHVDKEFEKKNIDLFNSHFA